MNRSPLCISGWRRFSFQMGMVRRLYTTPSRVRKHSSKATNLRKLETSIDLTRMRRRVVISLRLINLPTYIPLEFTRPTQTSRSIHRTILSCVWIIYYQRSCPRKPSRTPMRIKSQGCKLPFSISGSTATTNSNLDISSTRRKLTKAELRN